MAEECCDPADTSLPVPDTEPPCTEASCSIAARSMRDTSRRLSFYVRWLGSPAAQYLKRFTTAATDDEKLGVIRDFVDSDGTCLGSGVDLYGNPNPVTVACTDAAGNDTYVNTVRKIRNTDGTVSLGGLPIGYQDTQCVEGSASCGSRFPEAAAGTVYGGVDAGGCAPNICSTLTNESCYPMRIIPKVTIEGAQLGKGLVTMRITDKVNNVSGSPFPFLTSPSADCTVDTQTTIAEGTVDPADVTATGNVENAFLNIPTRTEEGGLVGDHTHPGGTGAAGAHGTHAHNLVTNQVSHNHTFDGTANSHDHTFTGTGVDHNHTLSCPEDFNSYSGTIDRAPIELAAGATLTYCSSLDLFYQVDVAAPALLNFGKVTVCLDYKSIVTPTTIAALEGA